MENINKKYIKFIRIIVILIKLIYNWYNISKWSKGGNEIVILFRTIRNCHT